MTNKINIEITEGAYDSFTMLLTLSSRLRDFLLAGMSTNEYTKSFVDKFFGNESRMEEFLDFVSKLSDKAHRMGWCKDKNCLKKNENIN